MAARPFEAPRALRRLWVFCVGAARNKAGGLIGFWGVPPELGGL